MVKPGSNTGAKRLFCTGQGKDWGVEHCVRARELQLVLEYYEYCRIENSLVRVVLRVLSFRRLDDTDYPGLGWAGGKAQSPTVQRFHLSLQRRLDGSVLASPR